MICIRLATNSDFHDIKNLLNQLTIVGDPSEDQINKNIYNNIYVAYLIDNNVEKLIGCITLFIEDKIIHNGGKVGHIEDVVIDEKYRGKGIGKILIDYVISIAKDAKCYKVILDCDEENVGFYQKSGFKTKGVCMRLDLD